MSLLDPSGKAPNLETTDHPQPIALKHHVKHEALEWAKDTGKGILEALAVFLVSMILVQVGLARQGQELSLKLFEPYEFWKSFSGLVVEWSQFNEWLLLGLATASLALTLALFIYGRRRDGRLAAGAPARVGLTLSLEKMLGSMNSFGILLMLTTLLIAAYAYQQYLWNVELPVQKGQIGIAFTRQIGSTVASQELKDYMRQMGHEGQLVMKELPVTFDAGDVDKARVLAQRIGAQAVVIYREQASASPGPAASASGLAIPAPEAALAHHIAYIVFADPSLGVEVPIAQKDQAGQVQTVAFRTKGGLEAPRLEEADLSRTMEAAAGILLYDQDRYLPAIAHLQNALSGAGGFSASDGLVAYYLGNAFYLLDQAQPAEQAFDQSIRLLENGRNLGIQDRLTLVGAYSYKADLLFGRRQLDEANQVLQKAISLRKALDRDQDALQVPATSRRMRNAFAAIYLQLMDIAQYQQDSDRVSLWRDEAKKEGKALLAVKDDRRSQLGGLWALYRTSDCETAYQQAYALLDQDPQNIMAHRLISRIASARANGALALTSNPEVEQHLEAILKYKPDDLPTLQTLSLDLQLRTGLQDRAYLRDLQVIVDRILEIDPSNSKALEALVGQVEISSGIDLTTNDPLFDPGVDARTLDRLQASWRRDPARIKGVLDQLDAARPYATRWAEEVQPNAAAPALARARLSRRAEYFLYAHSQGLWGGTPDPTLVKSYEPASQRAIADAKKVLDPARSAAPYEKIQAYGLLVNEYSHRLFSKDPAAVKEASAALAQNAEAAAALLQSNPPSSRDERYTASSTQIDLFIAYIFLRNDARTNGQAELADRYDKLSSEAQANFVSLSGQVGAENRTEASYLDRVKCPAGLLLPQAADANAKGDHRAAAELVQQYLIKFPHDPLAMGQLGWYRYLNGELPAALAATEQFEKADPPNPLASSNRAVILLAAGRLSEAQQALAAATDRLKQEKLGHQLQDLASIAGDLFTLAQEKPAARAGVQALLASLEKYVGALPVQARSDQGARFVLSANNLSAAAIWAGDFPTARRFAEAGLSVNPDYVLLRTNLAAAWLLAGEKDRAAQEYDRAIASAGTYLQDVEGQPLRDKAREEGLARARQELEAAAKALESYAQVHPELQDAVGPFVRLLRQAETRLKVGLIRSDFRV